MVKRKRAEVDLSDGTTAELFRSRRCKEQLLAVAHCGIASQTFEAFFDAFKSSDLSGIVRLRCPKPLAINPSLDSSELVSRPRFLFVSA